MAFLRKLSIRSQLLILAGSTILVILIIIFHSYSTISGMLTRSHEEYVNQTVAETRKNVTSNKDVLFRLMQTISYHSDVQSYLIEQNAQTRFDMFKTLNGLLTSQRELKDGILDIVISGDNGYYLDINGGGRYGEELKTWLPKGKVNAYYAGMRKFGSLYGSETGLVFATTISYVHPGELFNKKVGTLFFIVEPRALVGEQDYSEKRTSAQIYLLDRDANVITSNTSIKTGERIPDFPADRSLVRDGPVTWQGKQFVVQSVDLPSIDAAILSIAPKDELLRDLLVIRRQELIVLGIGLLVLAIPFAFIINNILRPIKKMIFYMTSVPRGDELKLRKRISLKGYMEVSIMAEEFNLMLDEIERLTQSLLETNARLYGTELERKKSELAFLRSQVNPHFLYNTLEAITGMAAANGHDKIKETSRALSNIFRYSVKGTDTVELEQELLMIRSFVRIQQIRFSDRFTVRYDVAEEAMKRLVPKMILQPLVENAIYHGIEPTLKPCALDIEAYVDEQGALTVEIRDDGVGIEPARLAEIKARLNRPVSTPADSEDWQSIGLVNVNNRIRLMFGEENGLDIQSEPGRGTRIRLKFGQEREESDV